MIKATRLLWRRLLLIVGHDRSVEPLHLVHVARLVLFNDPVVERGDACLRGLVVMTEPRALERIHRCCCRTRPLPDRGLGPRTHADASGVDGRFDDLHVEGTERSLRFSTKTSANEDKESNDSSPKNVSPEDACNLVGELGLVSQGMR
jgi:hypothetical protein